jgi:hypothetical protein
MHDFVHSDVLIFSARVSHSKRRKQKAKAEFGNGMFVRVAGELISYTIETDNDPIKIDHFWIDISSGNHGLVRISLNTHSRSHAKANFDPRMRVAVFQSTWTELPSPGMYPSSGLDYDEIERDQRLAYAAHERSSLELLLVNQCNRASFIETWGECYTRGHLGIHQIHSRRASLSVFKDIIGRDGAIRFYFSDNLLAEMLLFKYAGQQ